jgi:hypothetical protein
MPTNVPFIGRRESIGVALEATPGTAAAPQSFQRHLALTLDQKTTVAQNTSAMGRIEQLNDSQVTEQWAEGSINGKITDTTIGYFLTNMFGLVTPTLHSGETTIYDNVFSFDQGNVPPYLTFARSNPAASRRYPLGTQSDIEIEIKQGGWATFTSTILSRVGVTSSESVAYAAENEFTSKHAHVRIATSQSGLASATDLQFKDFKIKISRKVDRFTPPGAIDPSSFDNESVTVTGSFVVRYTDTSIEANGLANTPLWLSFDLLNSDVTVGSAAHPELKCILPQVRLSPQTLDNPLETVLSATYTFTGELNQTAGFMIQPTLTNAKNGYAHA